eukprot:3264653-Prymnesium_polylepis.1
MGVIWELHIAHRRAVRDEGVLTRAVRDEGVLARDVRDEGVLTRAVRDEGVLTRAVRDEGVLTRAVRDEGVLTRAMRDESVLASHLGHLIGVLQLLLQQLCKALRHRRAPAVSLRLLARRPLLWQVLELLTLLVAADMATSAEVSAGAPSSTGSSTSSLNHASAHRSKISLSSPGTNRPEVTSPTACAYSSAISSRVRDEGVSDVALSRVSLNASSYSAATVPYRLRVAISHERNSSLSTRSLPVTRRRRLPWVPGMSIAAHPFDERACARRLLDDQLHRLLAVEHPDRRVRLREDGRLLVGGGRGVAQDVEPVVDELRVGVRQPDDDRAREQLEGLVLDHHVKVVAHRHLLTQVRTLGRLSLLGALLLGGLKLLLASNSSSLSSSPNSRRLIRPTCTALLSSA